MNIKLKKKTMSRGITLPEVKSLIDSPIESLPLPEKVVLPLQQSIGEANEILVKKGDTVLTGQIIADSADNNLVPVHATISGEVSDIGTGINPYTRDLFKTIVITSNGEDRSVELHTAVNTKEINTDDIIQIIRTSGIISNGSFSSPIHTQIELARGKKIDTLLLNGTDSELYAMSNHRILVEYGNQVLSGLNVIKSAILPINVYIVLDSRHKDVINQIEERILKMGYDIMIIPVDCRYPVVRDNILIKTVLGRDVPIGGVPTDVGAAVFNASSAKAIHEAIYEGKPFIDNVITLVGAVKNPKNLLVRFGTPLKKIIEYCGGMIEDKCQVITGGAITGNPQYNLDAPLICDTNCILVKSGKIVQVLNCINCGRCVEACPMGLMPCYYPKYVKARRYEDCKEQYVDYCSECGTCAYRCPSNIPIVECVRIAKRELDMDILDRKGN
ncbi:RnfABCDGE type electron transport complex subunit C [Chloroflexota bacterium]